MRYFTIVVFACIASAARVTAEDKPGHYVHNLGHTPPAYTLHDPTAIARGTPAATYEKHASGKRQSTTYSYTHPAVYRRFKIPSLHVPHVTVPHVTVPHVTTAQVKKAATTGKELASTAVHAAGGSQALAGNLGDIANYLKTKNQQGTATDPYAAGMNTDASVYRRDDEKKPTRGRKGDGKQRLPPQTEIGMKKSEPVLERESSNELELEARLYEELSARTFERDDELSARAFGDDDDLEARGLWSAIRHGAGALKDTLLSKKPPSATSSPSMPVSAGIDTSMGSDPNAVTMRDLDEYLDSRKLEKEFELFQREAIEDLEARDFEINKFD
ncbi:hypothetical protein C0991_009634 [Blastosporella zonata]|nr:hypothetical protein C0991_009634 [Blastosporella zonata]